jgi:SNF2 family DNA or RNA helicase
LIELWPEQEDAVSFVEEREASALFFQQRTGKTFITMKVLERQPRESLAVVLVCILNNKESTWRDKLAEFLPWLNVTDDWEVFKKLPFPKLLLVHFEALPKVATKIKRAVKWITFAIIDEAHRLKARGTAQSRAAGRLCVIRKRLILTGTPMEKQPRDLWGQFRFLLPTLFGSWKTFEEKFMDFAKINMEGVKPGTARWQIIVMQQGMLRSRAKFREDMMPTLIRMIKPYALRLTKEDVGIIPPQVIKVSVDIVGRQRRIYDTMKKHSVVHLGGGRRAMAPLTVTNIVKRRQIASGFVLDDDGECCHLGDAKLRKLMALIERLPKPIVVFTVFRPELELIYATVTKAGYDAITVSGATKKKLRPDIWRNFQRAQYDVIICQVKTGGVGVDLWKSGYAIAHSIGYSSIDFDQAISRMDSKEKERAAKIYVLCGRATIDEDLYDMVIEKGLTSDEVLKQLKKGAR